MQSPIVMSVVTNADDNQNQHSTLHNNSNKNNSSYLHQQQYTLETIFWPYTSKSSSYSNLRNKNSEQSKQPHLSNNERNNYRTVSNNISSLFSLHCWSHDYRRMQPLIINRLNKISKQTGNLFDQSLITLEDRSLSESYKIAGSNLQLVYQSSSRYV